MEHLRNVLNGMVKTAEVLSSPRPYQNLNDGFARDRQALQGDVNKVTADLNQQIRKAYGKQEYSS